MGNNLRCCLACVLPCGALDVVRIVHLNGHVEEYSRPVSAGEILTANPNHILSKPCFQGDHVVRRILIVSPDSDLKRGHIYFLIRASSVSEKNKKNRSHKKKKVRSSTTTIVTEFDTNNCLKEIPSKKKSSPGRRRSGRVGVWRPHLESISEDT